MRRLLTLLAALCALTLGAQDLATSHRAAMEALAGKANPWGIDDPTLFREYIAPLTSLGETPVDWLPVLRPIAQELTVGAKTPLEAAMRLNRDLWKRVGVIYSTKRDKPNQDPLHSIRIGMASCSGLSILLVDACRSVGIPARVVGCRWRNKPGNHTWVEVWSEGKWYPLGAFEDCPPDKLWFLADAADATDDDPRYAIYAARATPDDSGTVFYGWGVPAERVTDRYARKTTPAAEGVRVHIAAERDGARVAVPFVVEGKRYVTPGPLQDLNDYTTLTLPPGATFTIHMEGRTFTHRAEANAIFVEQL